MMGSAYGRGRSRACVAAVMVAGVLAGCGEQSDRAPVPSAVPTQAAPRQDGEQALALVHNVCRALATARPAAMPERPSGTALSAYVNVATPSAQRMITSLQRLST